MSIGIVIEPPRVAVPPEDEPVFEIIECQRVEFPQLSILGTRVQSQLHLEIAVFAANHHLGESLVGLLVHLPAPVNRYRRLDLAFVSAQRIAQAPPQDGSESAWEIVPDLVVEIINKYDFFEEMMNCVAEYFEAGVRLVWIICPKQKIVSVHESPTKIRVLNDKDELDGGTLLPGFRVSIASLFP